MLNLLVVLLVYQVAFVVCIYNKREHLVSSLSNADSPSFVQCILVSGSMSNCVTACCFFIDISEHVVCCANLLCMLP